MLLLRWSWRDLRTHWAKVVAIALVIGIGTGGYAGLTSTTEWRRVSYDASYRQLAMYDVRIDLAAGGLLPEGQLSAVLETLPSSGDIDGVEERLILPTQVDASIAGETVLVRGEITGSDFSSGGPSVNSFYPFTGRVLAEDDGGQPVAMLERSFARVNGLPDSGQVTISGGVTLDYVGQATTPEYFAVAPEGEMFMSEASYAALFTTLETAQGILGSPGMVNNLVLTLSEGADRDAFVAELGDALGSQAAATTVSTRDDNLSYTALTTDIDQDQAIYNALGFLLFAGAVGAAFNLIHRLAEQQRREIGIGMALGVAPRRLAFRPLLVSAQIAFLGVVSGVVVGVLIGMGMAAVFEDFVPLPFWDTSFQSSVFIRVALVGFAIPFLATAIPVWRAVRVAPIDAIKPSYLAVRGPAGKRRRLAANTFNRMPFANLRRTPRRTALTVFGVAAAVTVLVGFLGIMDSVFHAIDTAQDESEGVNPDRISVALDGFYPITSEQIAGIAAADSVATVEPTLRLVGSMRTTGEDIDTFLELADLHQGMWAPTITEGTSDGGPGLVLANKAAKDLGVGVGDLITVRHPVRTGLASFAFAEKDYPVLGLHPYPVRGFAYMDIAHADLMSLTGITNALNVMPAAGVATADVQRELFQLDGVASVQSVTAVTEAVRDAFDQMLGIIQVMVMAVLLLALLIAFNTAAINLDARAREHATMFAFGVRVRTAMRMAMTESLVVAIAATVVGIGGGLVMVWWMTQRLLTETLPDFGLQVALRGSTVATVVAMGVVAVTLAPLLTLRRMRKMDLPGTLRLVE